MHEDERKGPQALYTAGDAILYCIGDRAFPGIILSARYKSGLLFLKSGWEYIILCGGLTYKVQEEDLWPHQYRHDLICPFAEAKQDSGCLRPGMTIEERISPKDKTAKPTEAISLTDETME